MPVSQPELLPFSEDDVGARLATVKGKLREQTQKLTSTLGAPIAQPEIDTSRADHKHLQVRVPTAGELEGTIVTLGRRQEKRAFDGVGVVTNRHVVVDARGGKTKSTMSLQANGQLLLQSDDDSLYALSKGPAFLASSAAVDVVGAGGVFLSGGFSSTVKNPPITGEQLEAPQALEGFTSFQGAASAAWSATDTTLKQAAAILDALQASMDPSYATVYTPIHDAVNLAATTKTAIETNNAPGSAMAKDKGAVVIHGAGGVFVDTPESAVLQATKSLALSSDWTSIFGQTAVDLFASSAFSVTAGDQGRVYAGTQLRLVAESDKVHIGARKGEPVEVQAKAVRIGETSPADPQVPTEAVSLCALESASIVTGDGAAHGTPAGILFESHDVIEGKSKKSITLEAEEKLTVQTADKAIKIVVDSAGEVLIKAKSATVTVSDSGGVKVTHKQATIEASTTTVTAKSGGNKVEIGPAGVTVKGTVINIG
jgi:roadblock/LC7 domain-containing protein